MEFTCAYVVAISTGMDTISTGHVTEAITAIIASSSIAAETEWPMLKGISKSKVVISEETCTEHLKISYVNQHTFNFAQSHSIINTFWCSLQV